MKMSVIICDDLAEDRACLQAAVQEYGRRQGCQLEVQTCAGGEELIGRWSPNRWDLVLLDIFMDGLSGVETARRLRERDDKCEIVFVTCSQAHGVVSYDLRVLDYLVKPVSREMVFNIRSGKRSRRRERRQSMGQRMFSGRNQEALSERTCHSGPFRCSLTDRLPLSGGKSS